MLGFKLALAGGIAVALIAGLTMVYNVIRAGERARINAELATAKAEYEKSANEALDIVTAKLFNEQRERKEEREDLNAYIEKLRTIDACRLDDGFVERMQSYIGSGDPGEAAPPRRP